jgi:dihydrolipoamide dehydrogenase
MVSEESFDLVVIGAGPGGYVAALRAAQLGMRVACVEKERRFGGVCLNVGCIPSKALLDSTELYTLAGHRFAGHGLKIGKIKVDLAAMMQRKDKVVGELSEHIRKLLDGQGVHVVHGMAMLGEEGAVEVRMASGREAGESLLLLRAKNVLLATGSAPVEVPGLPFDGTRIVSSTEALAFETIPRTLGIVGGGYIGLELGSVWSRLGTRVTIIEMMPKIAGTLDSQVGRTLQRILNRQGLEFHLSTRVTGAEVGDEGVRVTMQSNDGEMTAEFERLLVAVGRRPMTRGLGLEGAGVRVDSRTGQVMTDAAFRTSVPSIYAVGDLVAGPMLAHKASAEGVAAVECMAGLPGEVNYDAIPAIVYTSPEVASVGLTEDQVKAGSIPHRIGTFPFSGVGRAVCMGETEGFVKIIAHEKSDRIIGVHILGPRASELIAECTLAMELQATSADLVRTIHAHPTFSESLREAALPITRCPSPER